MKQRQVYFAWFAVPRLTWEIEPEIMKGEKKAVITSYQKVFVLHDILGKSSIKQRTLMAAEVGARATSNFYTQSSTMQ